MSAMRRLGLLGIGMRSIGLFMPEVRSLGLFSACVLLALGLVACASQDRGAQTEASGEPSAAGDAGPAGTSANLQAAVARAVAGFEGDVGIYVRHLRTGEELALRADELFPTASMIKVPILCVLYDRIEKGEVDPAVPLTWDRKRIYAGSDLLANFTDGSKITIPKLVMLMETMSDNTASLWLQELSGTGTRINEWLAAHGYSKTRMNSRTPGRKDDWKAYGWGQTTPREMADLLVQIREGRGFSPSIADEMYRSLTRSFWNREALSQIPPWVQAASKQGAVSQSRSEVVLVNAPHGDYVFCVITNDQTDKRWTPDNAGYVLLRRISHLLWEHFEPASTYRAVSRSGRHNQG